MRLVSEDILAWLLSSACLVYILRSIKQVLLPDVGFWRSPFVMFCAGALFSVAATVVAVMCCVLFLTERVRRNANGEDRTQGPPKGINGVRGIRRPWLVRRGRGAKGDLATPQLVTTHPSAVRDGSYSGPVWIVPATLWTRGQLATQFPPPTQGPAAIARKYHATLICSHIPHGPALWLVPDRVTSSGAGNGGAQQGLLDAGSGDCTLMSLEGVTVDLLRDVLVHRSPWAKRCPLQLSHPTRPLLLGETTLYMFSESGSAKEQWYAALTAAVAPQSVLASTQNLYDEYCRFMASLQVVQPPPLPAAPPPVMLRAWRFGGRHHQHGLQEQQPHGHPDKAVAAAADNPAEILQSSSIGQENKEQQHHRQNHHHRKEAPKPAGQPEAGPAPRPRGGRNPFGFILSRFGRRRAAADAAPAASTAQSQADFKATESSRAESVPQGSRSNMAQPPSSGVISTPPSQGHLQQQQQQQQLQQSQESLGQDASPDLERASEQGDVASRLPTAPETDESQSLPHHHLHHHQRHQQSQGHLHNRHQMGHGQHEQQEVQPSGSTPREQPGSEDAGDGAGDLTAPPVYRDVSDIFKASTPFSPTARDEPAVQVAAPNACSSAPRPCVANEAGSAGNEAPWSETATGLGRDSVDAMNGGAGAGPEAVVASAPPAPERAADSLPHVISAASAAGAAAGVMLPAAESAVTAAAAATAPCHSGIQAERDVRQAMLQQRDGHTQSDIASAAQVEMSGTSVAGSGMQPSPRSDRAEPSFNRWSDMPTVVTTAVKSASLRRMAADAAQRSATPTLTSPGEGAGLHTVAQSCAMEPPVTPGSCSPGRDAPPQITLPPLRCTEQQLPRRSLPGHSADLSLPDGPAAWQALQSTAATPSAAAPGAATADGRWGPSLLAQQSARHGASMPDLFEVARRIAEAEALQEGALPAAAALGDQGRRSLDECGPSGSQPERPGQGQDPGAPIPTSHKAAHRHTLSLPGSSIHGEPSVVADMPEGAAAVGSSPSGSSGGANTGAAGTGSATPQRNLSKQDLRRLQREEQERQKQEQQRAKAAARAAEEARRAEERANRERARVEAQQRRQEEEARARQARERARALKQQQLGSAKSLQDLAAAAAGPSADPSAAVTPRSASVSVPSEGNAGSAAAAGPGAAPASPAPSATSTRTAPGTSAASAPAPGPDAFMQLPAPSAPPCGALVEALYGLNMVLVRIGFELLRRRGFSTWLHRIIQRALDRARRPGFLDCLVMRRFDLGFTAPQLRNVRSVAGPYNCGPGSSTWPQLALDIVWVGNATATISTKIDFDKAATDPRPDQPANTGSAAATTATAMQTTAADFPPSQTQTQTTTGTTTPRPETPSHTSNAGTAAQDKPVATSAVATPSGPIMESSPAVAGRTIDEVEASAAAAGSPAPPLGQGPASGTAPPDGASGGSPPVRAASSAGDAPGEGLHAATSAPHLSSGKAPEAQPNAAAANTDGRRSTTAGATSTDRDAAASGTGGAAGAGGGGGGKGGGFWNFVPFFSLLRKAGQALASNIAGSLSGTPVEVHLRASRFEGTLLLWLAPPPSDRLWLSFAEPPKMDFTVTPVLGNRKLSGGLVVGRLSAWVRSKVTAGLSRAMVFPACVDVRMGRLLLSIDSPGDALRPFELPPMPAPPPPAFVSASSPQPVPLGTHPAQPPMQPHQLHGQQLVGGAMPEASRGGEQPIPTPSGPPSARVAGRPPRAPLTSSSLPSAQLLGESSRATSGLVQPHTPPAPAAGGAGGTAFTASGFAAAAASTLSSVGSASLLENAFQHVIRGTSSIWGSSPGSLSPLEGMSDAEGEEEEEEEGTDEEEYGRELAGRSIEEGSIHAGQRLYSVEYGDTGGRGAEWSSPYMSGDGWSGLPPAAGGQRGSSFSNGQRGRDGTPPLGGEGGMEGMLQHRSVQESLASASWASITGQGQHQQLQASSAQAGRRRSGGPLHWMRGAAGLVARGVGGVGGAGMRGLGAVGSALGQAVLGPVVHAGERAVVHQQLHASRTPSRPEGSISGSTVDLNPTDRRSEGGASCSHSGQQCA